MAIEDDSAMLPIEVVAAVIRDDEGKILIAQRPVDKHQGGKWEFPGGKVEKGESRRSALVRELNEELGIEIGHSTRLISVYHEYEDKAIYLDVYEVLQWSGSASGREGQPIRWVAADALADFEFPAANASIVQAAILPKQLRVIGSATDSAMYRENFMADIESGHRLFLQAFNLASTSFEPDHECLNWLLDMAAKHEAGVVFESPPPLVRNDYSLHLSADELLKIQERPVARRVSASCSTPGELFKAQSLGLDFLIIGPVLLNSVDGKKPMGWPVFQSLSGRVNIPVYASGGVSEKDMVLAREYGAQGIVS